MAKIVVRKGLCKGEKGFELLLLLVFHRRVSGIACRQPEKDWIMKVGKTPATAQLGKIIKKSLLLDLLLKKIDKKKSAECIFSEAAAELMILWER